MFQQLLVPLDGSAFAEVGLAAARDIAEKFGSRIILLRVVSPPCEQFKSDAAHDPLLNQIRRRILDAATRYLYLWQVDLEAAGLTVCALVVEGKSVPGTILEMIDSVGADAIVMSTHGHGAVHQWLFGTVAAKVAAHAVIPVWLIRADKHALYDAAISSVPMT